MKGQKEKQVLCVIKKPGERPFVEQTLIRLEAENMSKHICDGCYYWRPLVHMKGGTYACHFMHDEGEPRGIPLEACAAGAEGSRRKDVPKTNKVRPNLMPRTKEGWWL